MTIHQLMGNRREKYFFSESVELPQANPSEPVSIIEWYVGPGSTEYKLFFIVRLHQIANESCIFPGSSKPFIDKNGQFNLPKTLLNESLDGSHSYGHVISLEGAWISITSDFGWFSITLNTE